MNELPMEAFGVNVGLTNEQIQARREAQAREEFERVTKNPPSKQALRHFFRERADVFLKQRPELSGASRKDRRKAARSLAKVYTKQIFAGIEKIKAQPSVDLDQVQKEGICE